MARARNIKPSIMDNDKLAELDPLARLLFIYLWMLADREGRLEDRPKRIAAQALPYDRGADVGAMLGDLQKAGFIARYEVEAAACIQILAFNKHQTPHIREADSTLPAYVKIPAKAVPEHNLGSAEASPRSPDSGFSDSGYRIGDSARPAAPTPAPPPPEPKASKRKPKTQIPEDFGLSERVTQWAAKNGFTRLDEHLEAFKRKVAANGYTAVSWDDKFMEAVREDWAKLRGRQINGAAPPADLFTVPSRDVDHTHEYLEAQKRHLAEVRSGSSDAAKAIAVATLRAIRTTA